MSSIEMLATLLSIFAIYSSQVGGIHLERSVVAVASAPLTGYTALTFSMILYRSME